jgi:urease accessory protein
VQRAFHPEPGGVCHSYLLHPPSGLVAGDELRISARMDENAHALLTTPAATKFYRSGGATAQVTQQLSVASGAICEWLPQENLLFNGARARIRTRVDLAASARFFGWEITCLGRPACGEDYTDGVADLAVELWRDGRPLVIERQRVSGPAAAGGPGLRRHAALGSLLATGADRAALEGARALASGAILCGVTLLDDVLVCRALAQQAALLRRWFEALWSLLRPCLIGRSAHPPRIWAT